MFVRELRGVHDLQRVGSERVNPELGSRDFEIRYIVGRNGEPISILEEFVAETGRLVNVFWQVDFQA